MSKRHARGSRDAIRVHRYEMRWVSPLMIARGAPKFRKCGGSKTGGGGGGDVARPPWGGRRYRSARPLALVVSSDPSHERSRLRARLSSRLTSRRRHV